MSFPSTFLSLEEDFVERKMAINNAIHDILQQNGASASATTAQLAQAHVVEAQRCMKLMSVEVRGKPPNLRKAMQTKINLYREELQGLLRDLERAQLMARETKSAAQVSSADSSAQYNRIMNNTNRLLKSSKTLESSQRIISETEEIGISVMDSLAQQRESLLSAHEKVRDTRESTSEARRVLQRMTRRVLTNNIVLYTMIAILIGSICLVIYHDFIKPSSDLMF